MKGLVILIVVISYFTACSSGPKPISYGDENCNFCSMTIMDDKHAAELITQKGRVYKFDSIECMIRSIERFDGEIGALYVMDFNNPNTLIEAGSAAYLISLELPSPMGANLTAFSSADEAKKAGYTGVIYNWEDIQTQIN